MTLLSWAAKHRVSPEALRELAALTISAAEPSTQPQSEARVQSVVRLEAAQADVLLFRNNVGASKLDNGSFVRWGLCNDSEKVNDEVKSGDLIGIRRTIVTPDMVGSTIGRFVSRECKPSVWKFSGTKRELAQLTWATIINEYGGDAKIVTGPGSF